MGTVERSVERYYCVDLLRGLAAIAVLIWHYNHFWHPSYSGVLFQPDRSIQPLYWLLWPLYHYGLFAVQFFWLISGFVFAHVYAGSKIGAKEFALRRFARLYPLHLITLLVVAVLQALSIRAVGAPQIIGNNDLYHFVLNLAFISGWGFEQGYSFNSPIWSVSVEEVLYAAFFLVCTWIFIAGATMPLVLGLLSLALFLTAPRLFLFAMCGYYFFTGCLLYWLVRKLRSDRVAVAVLGILLVCAVVALPWISRSTGSSLFFVFPLVVLAPILVMAGIVDERGLGRSTLRKLRWIGDATYSMYLWHFPIQVLILMIVVSLGLPRTVFSSPVILACWILLMLGIGVASYRIIERPLQVAFLSWGHRRAIAASNLTG